MTSSYLLLTFWKHEAPRGVERTCFTRFEDILPPPFFPRPLWGQEVLSDEFCMEFRQGSSFGYDLDDLTRLTTNRLNDISTRTYIPQKGHLVNWYLYSIIQYCIVLYTYIYIIYIYGDGSKPWYLVNPKIAGKWMFIPLKCIYRY